jgi:hypothetical protein
LPNRSVIIIPLFSLTQLGKQTRSGKRKTNPKELKKKKKKKKNSEIKTSDVTVLNSTLVIIRILFQILILTSILPKFELYLYFKVIYPSDPH